MANELSFLAFGVYLPIAVFVSLIVIYLLVEMLKAECLRQNNN